MASLYDDSAIDYEKIFGVDEPHYDGGPEDRLLILPLKLVPPPGLISVTKGRYLISWMRLMEGIWVLVGGCQGLEICNVVGSVFETFGFICVYVVRSWAACIPCFVCVVLSSFGCFLQFLMCNSTLMCSRSYYLGFILFCCFKWKNFHKRCGSLLLFLLMDDGLFLFHFGKHFSTFHLFSVLVIYCHAYWCILLPFMGMYLFSFL